MNWEIELTNMHSTKFSYSVFDILSGWGLDSYLLSNFLKF